LIDVALVKGLREKYILFEMPNKAGIFNDSIIIDIAQNWMGPEAIDHRDEVHPSKFNIFSTHM
jgi:hypothetical protein